MRGTMLILCTVWKADHCLKESGQDKEEIR